MQSLNKQDRIKELKQLYSTYLKDRNLVNIEWQEFFDDLTPDACSFLSNLDISNKANFQAQKELTLSSNEYSSSSTLDSIRALMLIRAYRVICHLKANLDPLNLTKSLDHP